MAVSVVSGNLPRKRPAQLLWKSGVELAHEVHCFENTIAVFELHHLRLLDRTTGALRNRLEVTGMSSFRLFAWQQYLVHFCDEDLSEIHLTLRAPDTGNIQWETKIPGVSFRSDFCKGFLVAANKEKLTGYRLQATQDTWSLETCWELALPFELYSTQVNEAGTLVSLSGPTECAVYAMPDARELWRSKDEIHHLAPWGFTVERRGTHNNRLELHDPSGHFLQALPRPEPKVLPSSASNFRGLVPEAGNARILAFTEKTFSRASGHGHRGLYFYDWLRDRYVIINQHSRAPAVLFDDGYITRDYSTLRACFYEGETLWDLQEKACDDLGIEKGVGVALSVRDETLYLVTHKFCTAISLS